MQLEGWKLRQDIYVTVLRQNAFFTWKPQIFLSRLFNCLIEVHPYY